MFEPQNAVIFNQDFSNSFKEALKKASTVYLFSAFIKTNVLKWLSQYIAPETKVKIIARWKLEDIVAGASDMDAYLFAKKRDWSFAINTNLHFKIYMIDDVTLFIGSANLTAKGLSLNSLGNDEAGVRIAPTKIDVDKLKEYSSTCHEVTNSLYEKLLSIYKENVHSSAIRKIHWPFEIQNQLKSTIEHLWVNDLFYNVPELLNNHNQKYCYHDRYLLNLTDQECHDQESLLTHFKKTVIWGWLISTIEKSDNKFVRFGEITAKLHTALLDDPKPYRKDVKTFLSNLFEWVRYLDPDEIGIKKFNRTEAIYLK